MSDTQKDICECGEEIHSDANGVLRHTKSNSLECGTVSRAGLPATPRQGTRG